MAARLPYNLIIVGVLAQFADKLALDTISLAAAASGAGAGLVGMLVAAQSTAWLLVSLPAGAYADRIAPRGLIRLGALALLLGSLGGAVLLGTGLIGGALTGAAFVAAIGPVVIALSVFVLLPRMVGVAELPRANGRIELGRALLSFASPLIAGWAVTRGFGALGLWLCAATSLVILVATGRLPGAPPPATAVLPLHRAIAEGGAFVLRHPYLRPIALCAIAWNLGFFALTALFAPYAIRILLLEPSAIGFSLSVTGLGSVAAALTGAWLIARVPTGAVLIFGPAVSLVAVLILALAPPALGAAGAAFAFLLLGYGPILWFITQTSLRQAVTPAPLLGRVSATLTTAMYGMRPLGALAGGFAGEWVGLGTAIWLPAVLFGLSTLAIVASAMPGLKTMPRGEISAPAAG